MNIQTTNQCIIKIDQILLEKSQFLCELIETLGNTSEVLSLPIHSEVLQEIISILTQKSKSFLDFNTQKLIDILKAADYLNIPELIDFITQRLGTLVKNKSPKDIKSILQINNGFLKQELDNMNTTYEAMSKFKL